MNLLICPGIHPPGLTDRFIAQLQAEVSAQNSGFERQLQWHVLPDGLPPYSPHYIAEHFESVLDSSMLDPESADRIVWIAFSAGVVGAIATARTWQRRGLSTTAFIAFDGWGVPLAGDFPLYRFSHDHFTAQTSEWPQTSMGRFHAEPAVEHLELWRSPQTVNGVWQSESHQARTTTTAAALVNLLISFIQ